MTENNPLNRRGFTLIELMVSILLLSLTLMMLVGYVVGLQNAFFNDVVRTRINSNLRTALDILAMNIRQSGENLGGAFPAMVLEDDGDGTGKHIVLRRNLISEVLTICESLSSGDSTVLISTTSNPTPACVFSNVNNMYNTFRSERTKEGGEIRLFLYNSTAKSGEYVDYTNEGTTSGKYSLNISSPTANYPANTSYIYYIEEYDFSLEEATSTLNLTRDGEDDLTEPVAFSITAFDIELHMKDGSILNTLLPNTGPTWKDLQYIAIELEGSENRKSQVYSTSVSGNYYPRNILSR